MNQRPTPSKTHYNITDKVKKKRILKAVKEKQLGTYKEALVTLSEDFSAETLQAKRESYDILKVLKAEKSQPKYSTQLHIPFRIKREIENFLQKQRLKESITTKLALQKMLKYFFKLKRKDIN